MPGTVVFRYDHASDIHFCYPKWNIETAEDCKVWYDQFVAYFSRFEHQVDVIIVLDEFRIGPKIGSVWGKYRAEWVGRYTRHSVRVRAIARVKAFTDTSGAIYGAGSEEAGDEAQAIELIRRRRSEAQAG